MKATIVLPLLLGVTLSAENLGNLGTHGHGQRTSEVLGQAKPDKWVQPHTLKMAHFRAVGTLIGSVNYAHISLRINLAAEDDKINVVCSFPERLRTWVNRTFRYAHHHDEWVDRLGESLQVKCDLIKSLYEDAKLIWLHQPSRVKPRNAANETVPQDRENRQAILAGIIAEKAVEAASSLLFTTAQLLGLTNSEPDDDTKIILQTQEEKLSVHEGVLSELNHTLRDGFTTFYEVDRPHRISEYYDLLSEASNGLHSELTRLVAGFHTLTQHHLSPDLLHPKTLGTTFVKLKARMHALEMAPLVDTIEDMYRCSSSHVLLTDNTLIVLLHIPIYRTDSLLELYRLIRAPLDLSTFSDSPSQNPSRHLWIPKPEGQLIAVSPSRTLFRPLLEREFGLCRSIGKTYYCPSGDFYDRRARKTCLAALFLNEIDDIKQKCEWEAKPRQDYLSVIAANEVVMYQERTSLVEQHCGPHVESVSFTGAKRLIINPGCRIISKHFIFDGATNVYLDPGTIVTRWIDLDQNAVKLPTDSKIDTLLEQLSRMGQSTSVSFNQLSNTYWKHHKQYLTSVSIITLLTVVGLICMACLILTVCPLVSEKFTYCRNVLNLCMPCCTHTYRITPRAPQTPALVEQSFRTAEEIPFSDFAGTDSFSRYESRQGLDLPSHEQRELHARLVSLREEDL